MCMSCELKARAAFQKNAFQPDDLSVHYGAAGAAGAANLLEPDIANDTSTTTVLRVGGPAIVSTIGTIGDKDFVKVELVAGRAYEFGMFAKEVGPSGIPLVDSYLELYAPNGTLITAADGGASTQINTANSGFDAILGYTPTVSGTYFLNARAFDNLVQDGPDGDLIGDYTLSATDVTDLPRYEPYYDPESPLHSLDWGSQVDGTVRNPDGKEVGHITGNPAETPDSKGATVGHFGQSTAGKNVIKIYFAKVGDVYGPEDPTQPGLPPVAVAVGAKDFEVAAVWTALAEFEKVADVVYVETQVRAEADFHYVTYTGTPGPGVSLLGSMSPPQESDEGLALFNSGDERWNAQNLAQGGFSFVTLIHEFGHGHGMAHPHDNGGRSSVMRGVVADGPVADYTTGDFDLNQAVHTMMSYQDGYPKSPYGNAETNVGYGYLGGLMAFDIAVIQDKYGVNEDTARGNDIYTLKDVNAAGTFYSSIWDTGGTDQIAYGGARDANIDLRAASLKYEVGGGGRVSYAFGVFGGYTIANGVVIENATSGSGNDTLTGNEVANVLTSGAGNDVLDGGAGADRLVGGLGDDTYYIDNAGDRIVENANEGNDTVVAAMSLDLAVLKLENLTLTGAADLSGFGNEGVNVLTGNAGKNMLDGRGGADLMIGGLGDDTYQINNAGDRVVELAGEGVDTAVSAVSFDFGAVQLDNLVLTGAADLFGRGNDLDNVLTGNGGANTLEGRGGADVIDGKGGADKMIGGAGDDTYYLNSAGDRIVELAGEGNDTAISSVSLDFAAIQLENFELTGSSASFGHGNELNNKITGNTGANVLEGRGGADTLTGGAGADRFVFKKAADTAGASRDVIVDFASGSDKIDLSGIDARSGTTTNDAFTFIGTGAFTGQAGQLRYVVGATATEVLGDVNGDGAADFSILLANRAAPVAGDFIL